MGMTTEEILIKVGVDTSQLKGLGKTIDGRFESIQKASQRLSRQQTLTNNMLKKADKQFRNLLAPTKRFKMELLSLGFGFAMISRGMNHLLQPAFDTVGIFDLFSTMLQITFLPIALFVLDNILLPLFNYFTNLSEPVQFVIGAIVALGAALATIAAPIAFLGLFADSFAAGIAIITTMLSGFWVAFAPFLGIAAIFAIIIIALVGFWKAWKENFGNIKQWAQNILGGITQALEGFFDILGGITDIFIGIFTLDGEKIKEGFKQLGQGIIDVLGGLAKSFYSLGMTWMLGLLRGMLFVIPTPLRKYIDKLLDLSSAVAIGMAGGGDYQDAIMRTGGPRQTGGEIPYTGLYKLHRVERVAH